MISCLEIFLTFLMLGVTTGTTIKWHQMAMDSEPEDLIAASKIQKNNLTPFNSQSIHFYRFCVEYGILSGQDGNPLPRFCIKKSITTSNLERKKSEASNTQAWESKSDYPRASVNYQINAKEGLVFGSQDSSKNPENYSFEFETSE